MKPTKPKASANPAKVAPKSIKKAKATTKPAATSKSPKRAKATPSAAPKTTKKAKMDDAALFKTQITRLGKSTTERDALVKIIVMFDDEGKGSNLSDDVVTSLIKALQKHFKNKNHAMVSDAASALSIIARVKKYVPLVIKSNILKHVVPLLDNPEEDVIVPLFQAFGYIAENDSDAGVKAVVDAGVLKKLKKVFTLLDDDINAAAIKLLRRLCATTGDQDQFFNDIFDEGLIVNIINHLDAPSQIVKIGALNAMQDLISFANEEQIHGIVEHGAISDLCNFFGFDIYDCTLMTLNCLTDILSKSGPRVQDVAKNIRDCGGVDYISDMQEDEDDFIREACEHLMEEYLQ